MSLSPLIVLCVSLRDCPNTLKPRLIVHYVSSTVDHSVCLKRLSEYSKCEIICSPHLFHQWIILSVSPSPRDCTNSMIWPKATVILKLIKNNSRRLFKRQQECDKIGNCHHKLAQQIETVNGKHVLLTNVINDPLNQLNNGNTHQLNNESTHWWVRARIARNPMV